MDAVVLTEPTTFLDCTETATFSGHHFLHADLWTVSYLWVARDTQGIEIPV